MKTLLRTLLYLAFIVWLGAEIFFPVVAAITFTVLRAETHTAGTTVTWSHLEELCLEVTRAAGVDPPELNAYVDPGDGEPPVRSDFVWRSQQVTVEADGFGFHKTRQAFEDDRRRDQRLIRVGWRPVRVTQRQLKDERARIAALLIDLLTRS